MNDIRLWTSLDAAAFDGISTPIGFFSMNYHYTLSCDSGNILSKSRGVPLTLTFNSRAIYGSQSFPSLFVDLFFYLVRFRVNFISFGYNAGQLSSAGGPTT